MIAHLESLRTELTTLSASAAQYRLLIEEVEQRQATVQAALDAVVFPILTLPPEVTTEIFLHCAVPARAYRQQMGPPPKDILDLTTICWGWRNLALSIPRLWSTLKLNAPRHVAQEEMAAVAHSWFSRAGALPLGIQWMDDMERGEAAEINAVLRRYAPGLQDLSLAVTSGRVCDLIGTLSFPLLRHLCLRTLGSTPPSPPIMAFRATPQLRQMDLHEISPSSLIGIRWELLESLIMAGDPHECLDVLRKAPSLLKCKFYDSESSSNSHEADQDVILHPRLATLTLELDNFHIVMRYLTLPSLHMLSLCCPSLNDGYFLQFLSRSRAELHLRSFELDSKTVPVTGFQRMMHLTNLTLWELQVESRQNLVRALNRHHGQDFLPVLETLTLKDRLSDQLDMQLVDALASRSTAQEAKDDRPAADEAQIVQISLDATRPHCGVRSR
ncbi:hypothetical protein C8R46DRAFT_1327857 [Mycena filopes]|nr:hypothetical protein C8R46DRAFT_1327857 [Mycena filopes]